MCLIFLLPETSGQWVDTVLGPPLPQPPLTFIHVVKADELDPSGLSLGGGRHSVQMSMSVSTGTAQFDSVWIATCSLPLAKMTDRGKEGVWRS